jgi:Zn-dependent protease/predicted transcriptional regulator
VAAFSLSGIRVRIDQSWYIAFFLFAWTLSEGYFPLQAPNYSGFAYWTFGTLSAVGLFASVLIHELSHCVVARRLGVTVRQITLFIFGGVSEMAQSHSNTPGSEFRITIAGPLSSVGLGIFFTGVSWLLKGRIPHLADEMLHYLVYVNFLLAVFNLIPGFPLDGGRVLRSYLWHRTGSFGEATRASARIGGVFATAMMAFGFLAIVSMHFMVGIWLVLIGIFLKKSAESELRAFQMRTGLENVKVRDIMVPPVAVNKGTTIADLVNQYVFHYHDRVFPVVDRGRFIGMIDVSALKKVPTAEWPSTYIDAYMADSSQYSVLEPDMDARDALRLLVESTMPKAPIVQNDVLVGFLTRMDLAEVITLKSDLAA